MGYYPQFGLKEERSIDFNTYLRRALIMDDNLSQQIDEIEVLKSIYGDTWRFDEATCTYSMDITPNIRLYVTLNHEYPSNKPPNYELLAPVLSGSQKVRITQELQRIYEENPGTPILFQWIERLKELIEEESDVRHCNRNCDDDNVHDISPETTNIDSSLSRIPKYEVVHGSTIVDRKSVFQGHCSRVDSLEDIRKVIDFLMENKKIKQATHNISAYAIQMPNDVILQDCDDDGESHAGSRVLHLLQILEVKNVLVVVSRWYGGIHLGPDRFKHINNAARQVLEQAGFVGS